ncbi:hypothetical protein HID58_054794 [Brassica napus]|uniref:Uncharacterized protein n=1 Tax=Brassica napus TaxID=3708 RepID=A0ABQ8AIN5_BRANA|nr:hypothetical protein HID58_054794 [Brassica napus]
MIKTIIENGQESPLLQASKSSMEDGEDELSRWEIKACGPSKISLVKVNMWAIVVDELWFINAHRFWTSKSRKTNFFVLSDLLNRQELLHFVKPESRRTSHNLESLRLGLSSQSIASGFLRFWDSLNFKKDREFVGMTVFSSMKSGMTYQQLKLVISQQLIPYFSYLKKSTVFLIYFFIYATLASVMDSSLPRIALSFWEEKDLAPEKRPTLHSKRNSRWKLIFLEAPRLQDRIRR